MKPQNNTVLGDPCQVIARLKIASFGKRFGHVLKKTHLCELRITEVPAFFIMYATTYIDLH